MTTSILIVERRQPATDIIRTIRSFFGLRNNNHKKTRIIRKYNKAFEEFIFKGYDQQTPGLSRPGSFKLIRMICKN